MRSFIKAHIDFSEKWTDFQNLKTFLKLKKMCRKIVCRKQKLNYLYVLKINANDIICFLWGAGGGKNRQTQ